MPEGIIDALAEQSAEGKDHFAIAPGLVTENFDLMGEGRIKVRIPAMPGFEPWARVCSVGGGSGRGFCWMPQVDDEVLVAFAQNDPSGAYILGGVWSSRDRPPISDPLEFQNKRVIKTGISSAPGHEVEFDDLEQSVTITTSTKQKITLDPLKIELSASVGSLTITMDGDSQTITIQSAATLELKAPQITIEGLTVEIKATDVSINGEGPVVVQGLPIKLN